MEIFIDGGLFELIIAIAFGYAINFIFLKKYLLFIFSAIAILAPIALFFFNTGEPRNWIIGVCIINAILLVTLLWKHRFDFPNRPLLDTEKLKSKFHTAQFRSRFVKIYHKFIG